MRRPQRTVTAVISLAFVAGTGLAACAGSSASSPALAPGRGAQGSLSGSAGTTVAGAATSSQGATARTVGEIVVPAGPLVIRSGTVSLSVAKAHVVDVFDQVSSAAETMGGFVASSSSTAAGDAKGAMLVVRVPSSDFGSLVSHVDSFAKVQAQSENGQDVTAESINLTARIANLTSEEAALRALLSRAGSIPSILQVQDQLFSVEGDVEQLSAQHSSLIDQATYATLTVNLVPLASHAASKAKPKQNALLRAVKLAGHNTATAVRGVLLAIGWAFPFLVLGFLALGAWLLRRRIGRRHAPAPSASTTA